MKILHFYTLIPSYIQLKAPNIIAINSPLQKAKAYIIASETWIRSLSFPQVLC